MTEPDAFRAGAREAAGIPALVLAAGYIGFGALAAGHDLPLAAMLLSTLAIWALPAQLVMVEMHITAAPAVATVIGSMFSSARFLPMTLTLLPQMRDARWQRWLDFLAAHLLSMTGWAMAMARFPGMPLERRMPWFLGFTTACIAASAAATALGYLLAGGIAPIVKLGLVFLAPAYYVLILLGGVRERVAAVSLGCGALAGPLAHLLAPEWGVLVAGLGGGTVAFLLVRARA